MSTRHTRGSCLLLLAKTESICLSPSLCLNMTRERKESTHKPLPALSRGLRRVRRRRLCLTMRKRG